MITITRRQARCLRGVFRRHLLGITHRAAIPPLVFQSDGSQLRVRHRYAAIAIEHGEPANDQPVGTIAVPLDALADFEGRDQSTIVLEALAADRTAVRWLDGGVPQRREYDVRALDKLAPFPEEPAEWTIGPVDLLTILAEASATTSEDSTRYALACMQLRGGAGEVAATDGHQLLIRGGLTFPWRDEVLVRRSRLFGSRELPRDRVVMIGRTDSHVVLRCESWTIYLEVQAEGRFPVLGHVVPDPQAATARLRLEPEDVAFLLPALERLPGAEEPHAPVTLELNGSIAVRARSAEHTEVTELVLTRSTFTGTPIRVNMARHFLARALRLGLTEIDLVDASSPVVGRNRDRVYCWQPLSKESALEPTDDATRIESGPVGTSPSSPIMPNTESRTIVSERKPCPKTNGVTDSHAVPETDRPIGLAAVIKDAEALHESLAAAKAQAGRLVVALRRHRRRERLVATTLASLKSLKLQDVVE